VRRGEDHLGAVTGDGHNRRRADAFPYPYAGGRPRRPAPPACAGAGGDRRRGNAICQLKLAGLRVRRSAEEIGEPAARRMLVAKCQDGEGDRHADKGSKQVPQEGPEEDRKQHDRRGDSGSYGLKLHTVCSVHTTIRFPFALLV
jgi:hypothetical protein